MLPANFYNTIQAYSKFGNKFGFPLIYDKDTNRIDFSPKIYPKAILCYIIWIINTTYNLQYLDNYSIFPKSVWASCLIRLIFFPLLAQSICFVHISFIVDIQLISLLFLIVSGMLCKDLRLFRKEKLRGEYYYSRKIRTVKELPIIYRSIQVLLNTAMSLFGPIIIPFQGLIRQFVIFATYNVISQMEFLDFFSFSILIVGIVFGIGFWGLVLVFGRNFVSRIKENGFVLEISW
jgi:hypothetical protein